MAPAAFVPAAAAVGSLALNIANSGGGGNAPSGGYQLGNPGFQDTNFNNLSAQMYGAAQGLPGQLLPGYQQASQNIQNNPYAFLAQQGANQAGAMAPSVAGMQFGGANSLFGAGNQILGQAFDPQQALYNRTQQQVMDQINAANASSGVYGPAAAGVAQQGINNFNIDWQSNLLNRERMGIQAGGQAFAGASDLGGLGMQTLQSGFGAPYSTFLGQQRDILGGLNAYSTGANAAFSLPQQAMTNELNYLGRSSDASRLALAAQGQAFDQGAFSGAGLNNAVNTFANNPMIQSGLNSLFAPSPAYQGYNSQYGTGFTGSANDNFGYPGFDFAQAG